MTKYAMSFEKTSFLWFMRVPCVQTQKFISHGIEVQIETRLKCPKTIVNHFYKKPLFENVGTHY